MELEFCFQVFWFCFESVFFLWGVGIGFFFKCQHLNFSNLVFTTDALYVYRILPFPLGNKLLFKMRHQLHSGDYLVM